MQYSQYVKLTPTKQRKGELVEVQVSTTFQRCARRAFSEQRYNFGEEFQKIQAKKSTEASQLTLHQT